MAYGDFKQNILIKYCMKNPKYDEYQYGLASMLCKCFYKKTAPLADKSATGGAIKNQITSDKDLTEEIRKSIIRKFKKQCILYR